MSNITETFVKGSDNTITLTLTEDGSAISGAWSQLVIYIGDPVVVTITRAADGSGVALSTSTGVLTIKPGQLSEDLSSLIAGRLYRVHIKVVSATNPEGADFGADDGDRLFFLVDERPA